MRVLLVGADLEENLGVAMVAAAASTAGHGVRVMPFNDGGSAEEVATRIAAARPEVVGLSLQFQHRAAEFLLIARRLRELGFAGHMTCGGQLATLAWRELLEGAPWLDSVVLYDGEETFVALLAAFEAGAPFAQVAGLALPGRDGDAPTRTEVRPPQPELDRFPFPLRYRPHAVHVGVPFVPVLGSRGCWAECSFCSIAAFYRGARVDAERAAQRPHHAVDRRAILGAAGEIDATHLRCGFE